MGIKKWRAAGLAAGVALLVCTSTPVSAGNTSIPDGDGVDYDGGCVVGTDLNPPGPNSYGSTSSTTSPGCTGVSTYDGKTEGLDLNGTSAVTLGSNAAGQIIGSWTIDGTLPAPGSTNRAAYDLPDANFVGGNYFALYQNKSIQTNVAHTACPQAPTRPTPVLNRFGTWHDGFHFFVAFSVAWNGTKWIYSAQLGEYVPDGGYGFFELGVNDDVDDDGDGSKWDAANPFHPYSAANVAAADNWNVSISGSGPTTITVTAPGVYKSPDTLNCATGHFDYFLAQTGDVIDNVKGMTTANQVVTLPVTVPLSLTCTATSGLICEPDLTSVGGGVLSIDTTAGNSTAGLANSNITGIARTVGAVGAKDSPGPGPQCPTPTVGGAVPQNPTFVPNQACYIDDDTISRGSIFTEWWDTTYTFTF